MSPWGSVSLRQRADVVPFRKRDEPPAPSRPLPPAKPARPLPLRPAAIGAGQELLRCLKSYDLERDPGLRKLVQALDSGKLTPEEALELGRRAQQTTSVTLEPLPASHRSVSWR